ncbi:MAG: hypothetical protein K6T83_00165 [Alicyclobacillus sp.]|nr:hypothetical protein [Alicyclobacillus sp.]
MLRRFPLTYDDEFDKDIHVLLQNTPKKRRSERIRQLIRLGITLESHQAPVAKIASSETVVDSANTHKPESNSSTNVLDKPLGRQRKPLRFQPPST